MENFKYPINIYWSKEDKCYISWAPDFGDAFRAHGSSYSEALKNIENAIEEAIKILKNKGESLPKPNTRKVA